MHIVNSKLVSAANNYYNGRETGMTDQEYDSLLAEEVNFNPKFSIFDYVIYEGQFTKQKHNIKIPVWSKTIDWKLLDEIDTDIWVMTPKFDGCSIVAYYNEGKLTNILTRSNEIEGIVQTEKLKNKVPSEVDSKVKAILFEAVCIESRQKANGLINSKYKQEEVDELITLMPFDVITTIPMTYSERFKLTGLDPIAITKSQAIEIKETYTINIEGIGKVPADGVVFYNNVYPTVDAKILKLYGDLFAESVVIKVEPVFSFETLTFSLVYHIEPVVLGNVTVRKVGNAGSYTTCKSKKLGLSSKIQVKLAKQVIPQFKETGEWDDTLDQTIYCPYCGNPLKEFEGKLICSNANCNSIPEFFTKKYMLAFHIKDDKLWKDGINNYHKFKEKWELDKFKFIDVVRKDHDFKFYCCRPPRLKDPIYTFASEKYLMNFLRNDITIQQRRYFNMIFNRLKIFVKKLEELN